MATLTRAVGKRHGRHPAGTPSHQHPGAPPALAELGRVRPLLPRTRCCLSPKSQLLIYTTDGGCWTGRDRRCVIRPPTANLTPSCSGQMDRLDGYVNRYTGRSSPASIRRPLPTTTGYHHRLRQLRRSAGALDGSVNHDDLEQLIQYMDESTGPAISTLTARWPWRRPISPHCRPDESGLAGFIY